MAARRSEPRLITRGPYLVVGAWRAYQGDDEGPGWAGAQAAFDALAPRIVHRADGLTLGFIARTRMIPPSTLAFAPALSASRSRGWMASQRGWR